VVFYESGRLWTGVAHPLRICAAVVSSLQPKRENQMATFIATYDLNDKNNPHSSYLAAAIASGWSQWVEMKSGKWRKLPNTTIIGIFKDSEAALASFKSIKPSAEKLLGKTITVEKYFLTQYSSATVDSDEEKSSRPY
jgi:hypothetical protein